MSETDLLIILSSGLAVALEMSYDEVELRELWSDELEALRNASEMLTKKGIVPPAAITNVLRLAGDDRLPDA